MELVFALIYTALPVALLVGYVVATINNVRSLLAHDMVGAALLGLKAACAIVAFILVKDLSRPSASVGDEIGKVFGSLLMLGLLLVSLVPDVYVALRDRSRRKLSMDERRASTGDVVRRILAVTAGVAGAYMYPPQNSPFDALSFTDSSGAPAGSIILAARVFWALAPAFGLSTGILVWGRGQSQAGARVRVAAWVVFSGALGWMIGADAGLVLGGDRTPLVLGGILLCTGVLISVFIQRRRLRSSLAE